MTERNQKVTMRSLAMTSRNLRLVVVTGVAALLAALFGVAASAQAYEGITEWSFQTSSNQAGGHADVSFGVKFENRANQNEIPQYPPAPGTCNCEDAEGIDFHFPTGFIGDPAALPQCTLAEFSTEKCPIEAQVGQVDLGGLLGRNPFYNMVPRPDEAGLTAFEVPITNSAAFTVLHARTSSDYGLDASTTGIFHFLPISQVNVQIWGVPALPVHDTSRFPRQGTLCLTVYPEPCFAPVPSNSPPVPYLENPTSCGTPLSAGVDVHYYDLRTVHADTAVDGTDGCDQLTFNPSLTALPTSTQADSASGLDVDIKVPQTQNITVPSPSEIKANRVTLPPGFSINPNAADGKTSCTDVQGAFGTENAAQCPEESKVGTDVLTSTALPGPIDGAIYLGQPLPGDTYRIFLTADGYATHVKLAGSVHPDPQTGQLIVSFDNLPQSPFSDFSLHFFGSERGLLATPTQCGTYPVNTDFIPWDDQLDTQHSLSFFKVDTGPNGAPCPGAPRPFNPSLVAGTTDNTAGAHTPFNLLLSRPDGDQNLSSLSIATPPGLLATLKGITYCPDAALAAAAPPSYSGLAEQQSPSCPSSSQIGTATAGAGAGTHPVYLPGYVYLAGPYKGAPLSLAVITPAVSGPYDLGNVVVRAALQINPTTTQITAVSDPLPQIVQGVPLRLRSILINLNRQNFTLNPTNCSAFTVGALIGGAEGGLASLSEHFQVANCATLPFAPKLALALSGSVRRRGNPGLHATLTSDPGAANLATTSVALPHSLFLDNAHIQSPCTKTQLAAHHCPAGSVLGSAKAESPLLEKPLEGPVYLTSGYGHKLPDLVVELNGQIDVVLDGRIDTGKQGGLRTTFEAIPDAPVSRFTLSLVGGKRGLLQNSENLCRSKQVAIVKVRGQNGMTANQSPVIKAPCGKAARHKRHLSRAMRVVR